MATRSIPFLTNFLKQQLNPLIETTVKTYTGNEIQVEDVTVFPPIPENTIRAARAIYGRGNLYLRLGDQLNSLVSKFDQDNPVVKLEGTAAIQLGLITIIQYMEELTDIEVTNAIQRRHDLKYALHLDIINPGIYPSLLCAFRHRIFSNVQYRKFFAEMLIQLSPAVGLEGRDGQAEIDHVLNSICQNTIRQSIVDAMIHAIEALFADHFNWLRGIALPHWYQRYNRSLAAANSEGGVRKQEVTREEILGDIQHLLNEIRESNSRDIMEMRETKNLDLLWTKLTEPTAPKNCHQCIITIH